MSKDVKLLYGAVWTCCDWSNWTGCGFMK